MSSIPHLPGQATPWGLPLPPQLTLQVEEAIPVVRRGPGGSDVFYWGSLTLGQTQVRLLLVYRAFLVPGDVPRLKRRLLQAIEETARRRSTPTRTNLATVPTVVTDAASPSVQDACRRHGVALFDKRGTAVLEAEGVSVHRMGEGRVGPRYRPQLFTGRASRVLRILLAEPGVAMTAREVASRARVAYSHVHTVLSRLEAEGFVARRSPRSGFRLLDPVHLIEAWLASGESAAAAVEAYYAPDTTATALSRADLVRRRTGMKAIFTLASGLKPEEVHVAALPHGLYVSGDVGPVAEALELRRTTPHNFFVMRAHPAVETDAGGIYHAPRSLPHGPAVATYQLILDLARHGGGRGKEQAESLLASYARGLPFEEDA